MLLVAGGIATYSWALGHWFVGVHDNGDTQEVAIFRGLDASVLGLDLYRFDHPTDLAVADLYPAARTRVRGGITATDAADADRIIDNLREQRLPLCETKKTGSVDGHTSSPTTAAGGTRSGATSTAASASTAASGSAGVGTATRPTTPTGSVARSSGTTATTSVTRSTSPQVPGEDCREAK